MGRRKIPGKKHHGAKDPLKQQEIRLLKIKNKINNPPEKDHQKASYKLSQFIKLKNDAKTGKVIKLNRSIGIEDKPTTPYKKIKPIKQLPNEDDEEYLKRVNRMTHESLQEAQYEAKYNVDVVRDPKTGEISVKKRPKDELTDLMKNNRRKGKSAIDKKSKTPFKVPKEVIKELLKEEKKTKKDGDIQEYKRDVIKFGELVHAPPILSTLPRRAVRSDPVPRPGKKNNLLLKNMLTGGTQKTEASSKPKTVSPKVNKNNTGLKGKRKDMPLATRLMLEDQQNRVIQLYKEMKKNKLKSQR